MFGLFLGLHLKLWKRGCKSYNSTVCLILKVSYDNLLKKEQLVCEFNNDICRKCGKAAGSLPLESK